MIRMSNPLQEYQLGTVITYLLETGPAREVPTTTGEMYIRRYA